MTACIWMGIQLYWGGQAIQIILGSIIGPKFIFLSNTLPESAHVTTVSLISFFIFVILFLPILMIRPEHLQTPLRVSFVMICGTVVGMMIWAVSQAGGAGTLVGQGPTGKGAELRWNTVYGLQSIVGGYGSGILGQSDWTRYSSRPRSSLFGQLFTCPLTITLTALCGLLITSATSTLYDGEYLWNPFLLLLYIQQRPGFSSSASARAGTFFAGFGLLFSQLALCIVLNGMSCGMDLAALCSRYINIRRGTYICTIIAVAICPWQYVTQASVFITVLSGWSVFLSPMTGILLSDYFVVRACRLRVSDLYLGVDPAGAYWYTLGFNWRAFIAWTTGLWPLLPGFVRQIKRSTTPDQWTNVPHNGWERLYDLSYFFGILVAAGLYAALSLAFNPKDMRGESAFELKRHLLVVGKGGVVEAQREVEENEKREGGVESA
ncbi:putative ncs1 nucleoside transporter family protein [Phaeomoniella chlamydospora]|uniref:Putative ncs1 nucleoside transporter family protein n=1 Tax=Phaeomoniella chlamydospora TaxID=158046 RepID=A0A0G2DWQ0_PHACM|nr:putative ncs1 nucleoside transporter family protein [Phaeomoniella chlamydospora]